MSLEIVSNVSEDPSRYLTGSILSLKKRNFASLYSNSLEHTSGQNGSSQPVRLVQC